MWQLAWSQIHTLTNRMTTVTLAHARRGLINDSSDHGVFLVQQRTFMHLSKSLEDPCSCHFSGAPYVNTGTPTDSNVYNTQY